MRVRHRIPSIFNLSMVDVMCCALGCVILLWLINLREAKQHEDSAEEQQRQITAQLASIQSERDKAVGMMMKLEKQIEVAGKDKNDLQNSLYLKQGELTKSSQRIVSLESALRERGKR
jgi:septal ring factor EnvC (AmiA/AmiB activator)